MITVEKLKKNYGDFEALKGVSFSVNKGEIIGLLGPNGAGKTTTMKVLTGFMEMSGGKVEIKGMNLKTHALDIQKSIGYLPENNPLYMDLNVYEHLDFAAESHGITGAAKEKVINEVAKKCAITDKLYAEISELSKGYKQRVGLAQALIHNPDILILDEPTNGLDPNQIVEIRELIKTLGKEKTIILSTHIMQEVEAMCNRVILLSNGEIVAEGTPSELKTGKDHHHFATSMLVGGSIKNIEDALKIEGVVEVKVMESTKRGLHNVTVLSAADMRPALVSALMKAGLDVFEISTKTQSMEEVFQELTS